MSEERNTPDEGTPQVDDGYEAPAVETVLTAEELEREIQYAGVPMSVP